MIVDLYNHAKLVEQLAEDIVFDFTTNSIFHNGVKFSTSVPSYSNNKPLFKRFGQYLEGTTFDEEPITNILTAILYNWIDPVFELTVSRNDIFEIGTVVRDLEVQVYTQNNASEQTAFSLTVDGIQVGEVHINTEHFSYSFEDLEEDTTIVLNTDYIKDGNHVIGSKQIDPIKFAFRTYFGAVGVQNPGEEQIVSLASTLSSLNSENTLKEIYFNFTKQRFAIAIPVEEELISFKDRNGIELIDSFDVSTVIIKNQYQVSHEYSVYVFNQETSALGTFTVKIDKK